VKLSIIIPVFNEENSITVFLQSLQWLRETGNELIVVDGGSHDDTVACTLGLCDKQLNSEKGRALQMNAGANAASGDVLLFLHADTLLPSNANESILKSISDSKKCWGRFDVKLSGKLLLFLLIAGLMNLRSRVTGIATGDQAIFVRADTFSQVCGYQNIPLMEDIAISKQLKKISAPICLREKVITSSRRWEEQGSWKTIILMWRLRWAYFFGEDPKVLVAKYYH